MKQLLHPKFRLNGETFPTAVVLRTRAQILAESGNNDERAIGIFILEWLDENDFITVKTSGSTGIPKNITLQKKQVFNSADATVTYFNLKENSRVLLCLSAEYIAGKMMLVRGMIAGWDLYTVSPDKNPLQNIKDTLDFTAMVPYQVFHSLVDLNKVKKLIIGGGAISSALEQQLQKQNVEVFATYGMTETISHIAIRPINGNSRSTIFSALPNVSFSQTENNCLEIHAFEISEETVITNDVVDLLSPTSFKFLGRIDNIINTGGIKVHPENIEAKLSLQIKIPFFIASEKHDALGESVILVLETSKLHYLEDFSKAFQEINSYEKPWKIYNLPKFIYTETGKIKRDATLGLID